MNSKPAFMASCQESILDALPVMAGYFVVSFVFGVTCVNAGLPLWLPVAMCVFVYAGAAQFAALTLISSGASLLAITLSTLLINSRHVLMAVYMSKQCGHLWPSKLQKLVYAFGLTDESFALHSARLESGKQTSSNYMLQFNTYCHGAWVAGALAGALASDALHRLSQFKLDYALTAMMIFVLISLCTTLLKFAIAAIAIATTCVLNAYHPSPLNVFLATAAGCGAGLCLKKST